MTEGVSELSSITVDRYTSNTMEMSPYYNLTDSSSLRIKYRFSIGFYEYLSSTDVLLTPWFLEVA